MGVGEFLGKLFGAEAPKNEAPLRAYGKLPMYAEYRRLEVAPGTPTAFTQWLDAGRLAWVNSPTKSAAGVTRSSRLLLQLPESKELVVASVWDSRDTVGRVFPFCFFVVCPPDALGETPLTRLACALRIFAEFDRLHGELNLLGSGGDFYKLYAKQRLQLRPDDLEERLARLRSESGAIDAEQWFKGVSPDGRLEAEIWYAMLLRRGQRWHTQPEMAANLAVSCPLAPCAPNAVQLALWLEWLEPALLRAGRVPSLALAAEGAKGAHAGHILARDLIPNDFQLLTTDDAHYGFIERLADAPVTSSDQSGSIQLVKPATGPLLSWLKAHTPQPA